MSLLIFLLGLFCLVMPGVTKKRVRVIRICLIPVTNVVNSPDSVRFSGNVKFIYVESRRSKRHIQGYFHILNLLLFTHI